jgi:hypothetical protein
MPQAALNESRMLGREPAIAYAENKAGTSPSLALEPVMLET